MKPRLLDLFCCAGGSAKGYHDAGFEVVGVDIAPQPHYPFEFHQADAIEYATQHAAEFDAVYASPPCQAYSEMTPIAHRGKHPDLIAGTRAVLQAAGKPYVIENVPNARHLLISPVYLCGSMFGLPIQRHRYFEYAPNFLQVRWEDKLYCRHIPNPVLITDYGGPNANGPGKPRKRTPIAVKCAAIRIDWMTDDEITEAVPPAYTEYLGRQLMEYLRVTA